MDIKFLNKRMINIFLAFTFLLILFPPFEYDDSKIPITMRQTFGIPIVEHNFILNNEAKKIKNATIKGKLDKDRLILEVVLILLTSYFLEQIIKFLEVKLKK